MIYDAIDCLSLLYVSTKILAYAYMPYVVQLHLIFLSWVTFESYSNAAEQIQERRELGRRSSSHSNTSGLRVDQPRGRHYPSMDYYPSIYYPYYLPDYRPKYHQYYPRNIPFELPSGLLLPSSS